MVLPKRIERVPNRGIDLGSKGTILGDLGVYGDGLGVVAQKCTLLGEL